MLSSYPALQAVVDVIDSYLQTSHPSYFGGAPVHPVLPVKRHKILHDNLWGTNAFSWRELALIDCPVLQRLRDIQQVGLAYQTYMCARHSRFEHSLGVVIIATRVFDALVSRKRGEIQQISSALYGATRDVDETLGEWRAEMRLAALLHDTGHSLYSHTSERVYSQIPMMRDASRELSRFVGKDKGAGEVLAFCLTQTKSLKTLLDRVEKKLIGDAGDSEFNGKIDLGRVALLIVGRGPHPYLQFIGDIVSSGFDADKLDYLFRDSAAAGLPLRYDLDRYLHSVRLEKNTIADGEGELERLYAAVNSANVDRRPAGGAAKFPHYETYRLRLPREAMNTIEQLVLCRLMLFSYIYHHTKVRAAEGLFERLLNRLVAKWRSDGEKDSEILSRFLRYTDSVMTSGGLAGPEESIAFDHAYRISNRLLPREVFGVSGADASHAERAVLQSFLSDLQKKDKAAIIIAQLERELASELVQKVPALKMDRWEDSLAVAGVWFDVPKIPA